MQTLSKGFRKPQTGDLGTVWFAALEDDIQQLNDHTHDGNNSTKIATTSLDSTAAKISVLQAAFADQGDGYFRATVNIPIGSYDDYQVTVKDPTTKEIIYLKTLKVTTSQFYIYTNFVQDFEVFLGI